MKDEKFISAQRIASAAYTAAFEAAMEDDDEFDNDVEALEDIHDIARLYADDLDEANEQLRLIYAIAHRRMVEEEI